MSFASDIALEQHFDGLAVYCADGRFSAQCEDFLRHGLKLSNCDRLVLPGGPGALVGHEGAAIEHQGVLEDLLFLVDQHNLARVVLIAHDGCAFYSLRLGMAEPIESRQRDDLRQAEALIRRHRPSLHIDTYLARPMEDARVRFEPVHTE